MTEKERLHRKERKRERRREHKKLVTPQEQDEKEWREAEKIIWGERQLLRFAEPLIEQSKQREIAENIVKE